MSSKYTVEETPTVKQELDDRFAPASHAHGEQDFDVSYFGKSAHNRHAIVVNDQLFTCVAGTTYFSNWGSGRGSTGNWAGSYSVDNYEVVAFLSEANSTLKQVGGNGHSNNFALFDNGNLYTWGNNAKGSLGLGDNSNRGFPTLSTTNVDVVYDSPSNGNYHVGDTRLFVKKTDNTIWGTGYNTHGQLGLGDISHRNTWTQITSLGTDVQMLWNLGSSWGRTFVQKNDGKVYACGRNDSGQLGLGNVTLNISSFTRATNWEQGTILEIQGNYGHDGNAAGTTLMHIRSGSADKVLVAGDNTWGQLGTGESLGTNRSTPSTLFNKALNGIIDIAGFCSVGSFQTLESNGTLWAWGYNSSGHLGYGNTVNQTVPRNVQTSVAELFSKDQAQHDQYYAQSFIKKTNGKLYSCGNNSSGYLGRDNNSANHTTYGQVRFPEGIEVQDLGRWTTRANGGIIMALDQYNGLWAWGWQGDSGMHTGATSWNTWTPRRIELPRSPFPS